MSAPSTLPTKLDHIDIDTDFQKEYESIIKKASEFNKFTYPATPIHLENQHVFKKFSLYTDTPCSFTSFNTDAAL